MRDLIRDLTKDQTKDLFGLKLNVNPSITDGVHRNEDFVEIISVFSTFSNKIQKKYESHFM